MRAFLAPLPRPRLAEIAENLGLDGHRDLVPTLSKALCVPETIKALLEQLSPQAYGLLRDILVSGLYHFSISDEEQVALPEFRQIYNLGLIGVGKEYWGSIRIVVPEESYIVMMNVIQKNDVQKMTISSDVAVKKVRSRGETFLRNVTTLISVAENEGIKLTASGDIAKPFLLKRLLPVMESGDYGMCPDNRYPCDFLHAWRFAIAFEIIKVKGAVAVPGPMAEPFLESPDDILGEALLFHIMEFEPDLPIHWMIERLRMLPPDAWIDTEELLDISQPVTMMPEDLAKYKSHWKTGFTLLEMVGVIDAGFRGDRHVIALSKIWTVATTAEDPTKTDMLIVTPDFKISAPRNLIRSIRSSLSKFAHFITSDFMDQWEITQSSVAKSVDEGLTAEKIIEMLTKHSTFPPPKNVTDSIRIWEDHRKSLIYHHGPILIVDNEAEERFVRDILTSKDALLSNPAPNIFILHPDKADSVLEKIRARRGVGKIAVPRARKRESPLSTALLKRQTTSHIAPDSGAYLSITVL